MSHEFKRPDWCAAPNDKQLFMLQVMKDDEVLEVHRIRKGCFFFGRNADQVDYILNHASCSRVHAVLLFNPIVERFFLNDFGSANGSFLDKSKKPLEPNHLEYIPFEVNFRFGASTRIFRIVNSTSQLDGSSASSGSSLPMAQSNDDKASLTFDEETQRNTILNQTIRVNDKNISTNSDDSGDSLPKVMPAHSRNKSVRFSETVDFINLHETDENIGQFSDLAKTSFNPKKRKLDNTPETYPKKINLEYSEDNDDS